MRWFGLLGIVGGLLYLVSPAHALTRAEIQHAVVHYRYSVPLPKISGMSAGAHYMAAVPLCAASGLIIAGIVEHRELTDLEANEIVAGCFLPIIGPMLMRERFRHVGKLKPMTMDREPWPELPTDRGHEREQ